VSGSEGPFREAGLEVVRGIPDGRVATYGGVAGMAGRPGAARAVGAVLGGLRPTDPSSVECAGSDGTTEVPWWRVLGAGGRLTIPDHDGRRAVQRTLLEAEGVRFEGRRVLMERFGWPDGGGVD
jgi:methylated-DNA-protein-cysteine methyltransferase-like protein